MIVSTQIASAAGRALDKSVVNPFAGLTANGDNVNVDVAEGTNIKTYFDPATGGVGYAIGYPITGQGYTEAKIKARAALDWAATIPTLPETGNVSPGYFLYGDEVCLVIQAHDRSIWGGDPFQPGREALTRLYRNPWRLYAWKQPLDQYDAWKTSNAVTAAPDECTHLGSRWRVTQGDGGGNNVWEPGVFGWTNLGAI